MVIVKGDVFRYDEDIYKVYKASKKTIEKYRDYVVAQSMEEIDGYKEASKSLPIKYELSGPKVDATKKLSKSHK